MLAAAYEVCFVFFEGRGAAKVFGISLGPVRFNVESSSSLLLYGYSKIHESFRKALKNAFLKLTKGTYHKETYLCHRNKMPTLKKKTKITLVTNGGENWRLDASFWQ